MPAVRLSKRRRSSLAISFTPAKAGIYGIPRPVTFAPNVTPVTFADPEADSSSSTPEPASPTSAIFPPSETPAQPPTRRRVPPGKRRSMGYIPRPPNAFMLFRADFVRQKHVPGTIETNHGSLSKIIGNCWRALPLEEKRVWEVKAKHAKAEHKARYPEYRFRPVHNKNKNKDKKEKAPITPEDERRCEEVAQLLLEGKKGDELAAAVRSLDLLRSSSRPGTPPPARRDWNRHRRSSSVPLPNDYVPHTHFAGIALPSAPFFPPASSSSSSRPESPMLMDSIARQQQRMMLGNRRASSARPAVLNRSWTMPVPSVLQRDDSPLPEVDTSLFNPSFLGAGGSFSFASEHDNQFFSSSLNMAVPGQHEQSTFGSLDMNIAPHEMLDAHAQPQAMFASSDLAIDPLSSWMQSTDPTQSHSHSQPHSHLTPSSSYPSTAYSGSPSSPSESLPLPLHAPQPQSASATSQVFADMDMWKEFGAGAFTSDHQQFAVGLGMEFDPMVAREVEMNLAVGVNAAGECVQQHQQQHQGQEQHQGLEELFRPEQMFAHAQFGGEYADMDMGMMTGMEGRA
ncbi:putative high mobility group [Lyophyllum shimeji]|uniref:High mobility group n=1 Tax=Lyophyllum shimeji TaxID=47721 RepID=A0A9P3URQ8_LYOSH|nr:putative high mobility group [Lyophyllum shimeji]